MMKIDYTELEESHLSDADIRHSKGISVVWLLPIIALLIACWLGYKVYTEQGISVTIIFDEAEGIEAGKTKIKYKNIDLGTVMKVELGESLDNVLVTANFDNDAQRYLKENTRFWVVRPRIGTSGISGLGTLFSGAYIQLDPGDGVRQSQFTALEEPPVINNNVKGRSYILKSDNLGSLHAGAPIYYRGLHAGEILDYSYNSGTDEITINIFIEAPYYSKVRENTKFWDISGVEIEAGADGFDIKTGSVQSLLAGGIAFDSFGDRSIASDEATANTEFMLYEHYKETSEQIYNEKISYVMFFSGSVRGLSVGAPVEFRGIKLGEVIDIKIVEDPDSAEIYIPVTIELEPERIPTVDGKHFTMSANEVIDDLVQRGLRGQLQTGSLLTGQLYIDLEFHPDTELKVADINYPHPQLPTIPSTFTEIKETISHLANDLRKLPLDSIAQNLLETSQGLNHIVNNSEIDEVVHSTNETLKGLDSLVNDPELKKVIYSTNATLGEAKITLATLDGAIAPDSKLRYELTNTITELKLAARSIRVLTDYIERHPEAVIAGKK